MHTGQVSTIRRSLGKPPVVCGDSPTATADDPVAGEAVEESMKFRRRRYCSRRVGLVGRPLGGSRQELPGTRFIYCEGSGPPRGRRCPGVDQVALGPLAVHRQGPLRECSATASATRSA